MPTKLRIPSIEGGPVSFQPSQAAASEQRMQAEALLRAIPGVEGMGEGHDEIGDPAWIVYVRDAGVQSKLPRSVSGRPVVAEISGMIDILPAKHG